MSIETMTKLATVTVGSGGSSSIDFTNIPQTYTDLVIKISHRSSRTGFTVSDTGIQFNEDTGTSNYISRRLYGSGSSATSDDFTTLSGYWGYSSAANATASTFSSSEIYIPNYTSGNSKSYSIDSVEEDNVTAAYSFLIAGRWTGIAPITSIKLIDKNSANFVQHSTATLYGVKNARKTAGNSIKATGGNISFDGTYVYHVFPATGSFTPSNNLVAEFLVVAGGGGAGKSGSTTNGYSGGGGAGGYRSATAQSFSGNSSYTITVGAGGSTEASGSNSSISGTGISFSSTGGGFGGSQTTGDGASGGSGGGAGNRNDASPFGIGGSGNAGGYTPVEGFAGGNGYVGGGNASGSGGGGATQAGEGGFSDNRSGGYGGAGSNAHSTWALATGTGVNGYFAGGGGGGAEGDVYAGGAGGAGGGGKGDGSNGDATAGTANTGGGGGGGGTTSAKGGGSGIVIIRYKA